MLMIEALYTCFKKMKKNYQICFPSKDLNLLTPR